MNFPTTFREPQWVPKRRRKIHLAHRAKTLKPKIKTPKHIVPILQQAIKIPWTDILGKVSFALRYTRSIILKNYTV
jgi:hypothetical protein